MAAQQTLKVQNRAPSRPDGKVFELERAVAQLSGVLHSVLEDFDESDLADTAVPISIDISDQSLAKVFEWAAHHKENAKGMAGEAKEQEKEKAEKYSAVLTAWDQEFFDGMDSEMLYEVLMASNYLDIKPLTDKGCQVVSNMIRGKTAEEIREILGVEDDFTPEEDAAIREETTYAYQTAWPRH